MTEEPTKQRTRESSLSELLSPTLAESQAGIRGITLEDEVVTARELRARKRRRHTIHGNSFERLCRGTYCAWGDLRAALRH